MLHISRAWLFGSILSTVLACQCLAANRDIPFATAVSSPVGTERTAIDGGWRFSASHDILDPIDITIGRFPAKSAQGYAIEGEISGKGASIPAATLKVRWRNGQGGDAGEIDRALGYMDPDLSQATSDWTGLPLHLSLVGRAPRSSVSQGDLILTLRQLKKGTVIEIKGVSISEYAVQQQAKPQVKSITFPTVRDARANLFFQEESTKPEIRTALRNELPQSQEVIVSGRVLDCDGAEVASISQQQVVLPPRSAHEIDLNLSNPVKFGAYAVELRAEINGQAAGSGVTRFAWLRRPTITDAIRHHELYPFDLHPDRVLMSPDGNPKVDLAEAEFEAGVMRRLGVRGIRLQNYFWGLNYQNRDASVADARKRIETWKATIWPVLQRYGLEPWVSVMEQDVAMFPHTPAEFEVWRDFHRAQFQAYGDAIKFVLFGNEGIGGGMSEQLDSRLHMSTSKPASMTVRDWWAAYEAFYDAVKEGNPKCLVGPSHSNDMNALAATTYITMFGKNGKADIWGFNCYTNASAIARSIHTTLGAAGYEPKFAVVPEVGTNAVYSGPTHVAQERKQADSIPQTYLTTLAGGWVKRIDWFIIRFQSENPLSLVDNDWAPRPAAAAYLVLADTIGAGKVEKSIILPGGGEFYVWRRIDNSVVGVGWAAGEKAITLDTGGASEIEVSDLFGNREKRKTTNGIVSVSLNDHPVYVLGAPRLDESKALEVRLANVTPSADGPDVVAVQVRNNTKVKQTVAVAGLPTAGIAVSPSQARIEIEPGKEASREFQVSLPDYNDRVRSRVGFKIANDQNLVYETNLNDSFARCAFAPTPPSLDGTWKGWGRAQQLHADQLSQAEATAQVSWRGPDDLSAVIRTMWDDQYLYVGVETTDDVLYNHQDPDSLFMGDAIEIGFDLEHTLSNDSKLWQFIGGRSTVGDVLTRFSPVPKKRLSAHKFAMHPTRIKGGMIYQLALPWSELGDFKPLVGRQIGFGLIVDDSDGTPADRRFISWFGLGVHIKQPNQLGDMIFVK